MGKGSRRRGKLIKENTFARNWDDTFSENSKKIELDYAPIKDKKFDCDNCKNKPICKVTCAFMNIYLKKQGIFSSNYIRPRVSPKKDKKNGIGRWREIPQTSLGNIDEDKNPYINPTL